MKKRIIYNLVFCCLFWASSLSAQVIIVNPNNTLSELSRNSLRSIFAMRTPTWPDGSNIQVFVLDDDNQEHISFCKHILGLFPYQLRRIWDRQVFSGTGIAPILVNSEEEMRERIAQTKGAIGYIKPDMVDSSVKAIKEEL